MLDIKEYVSILELLAACKKKKAKKKSYKHFFHPYVMHPVCIWPVWAQCTCRPFLKKKKIKQKKRKVKSYTSGRLHASASQTTAARWWKQSRTHTDRGIPCWDPAFSSTLKPTMIHNRKLVLHLCARRVLRHPGIFPTLCVSCGSTVGTDSNVPSLRRFCREWRNPPRCSVSSRGTLYGTKPPLC